MAVEGCAEDSEREREIGRKVGETDREIEEVGFNSTAVRDAKYDLYSQQRETSVVNSELIKTEMVAVTTAMVD